MEELLKIRLINLAKQKATCDEENFLVVSFSSDVEDSYEMGIEDGGILLAREILDIFCIKY